VSALGQSRRSASIGCTLAARRAGIQLAPKATVINSSGGSKASIGLIYPKASSLAVVDFSRYSATVRTIPEHPLRGRGCGVIVPALRPR